MLRVASAVASAGALRVRVALPRALARSRSDAAAAASLGRSDSSERAVDQVDVLIVGGGPAGLSAAIRLKQLFTQAGEPDRRVLVVEKAAELGAHTLSGNVFETAALTELIPDWKDKGAPLNQPALEDHFVYLTERSSMRLPTPPQMHNEGNYIISLGNLVKWLGEQAEAAGVEIYPGIAASQVVYHTNGAVKGIATNDMGLSRAGTRKSEFQPGMELHAPMTLFAEGCRGSLSQQVMAKFGLRNGVAPQSYGIGLKELWEVDPSKHVAGRIQHTVGWPLGSETYGGSFLYHGAENRVAIGFVIGLDYGNPYLSPYKTFQQFKTHPLVRSVLEGGKCISYGARALNEGGFQSIPKLSFPGGALLGCAAGFMNVPKIKGTHTAMRSGMLAAQAVASALNGKDTTECAPLDVPEYETAVRGSSIWSELHKVRNIRPAFQRGFWAGVAVAGIETVTMGKLPYTLTLPHADNESWQKADSAKPIEYPKPDNVITFDLLTNLARSGTNHEGDQPVHLTLKDATVPTTVNLPVYGGPESRFCPAGVYEYVPDEAGKQQLKINAQNCLHCKTCDIADPTQNIQWVTPEGGGGPLYSGM